MKSSNRSDPLLSVRQSGSSRSSLGRQMEPLGLVRDLSSHLTSPLLLYPQDKVSGGLYRRRGLASAATNTFSWHCTRVRAQDKPVGSGQASCPGCIQGFAQQRAGDGTCHGHTRDGTQREGASPPRARVLVVSVQGPSVQPRSLC